MAHPYEKDDSWVFDRVQAGIIEEMVDDVMDTVDEADDEDAADEEVAKILTELNAEAMGGAKSAATHQAYESAKAADGDEEEDMAMLRGKLAALKG